MSTPFISEIQLFAFGFAPKGWALCNGQLLPINQNQALFSLIGTFYGGDGQVNFGLPNLKGRVALSWGQGPGLSSYAVGQQGGVEGETLVVDQMPAHTHVITPSQITGTAPCKNVVANQRRPGGAVPAAEASNVTALYSTATPDFSEAASVTAVAITAAPTGGSQPHSNLQPFLTLNYCIALQGIFPPR